MQPVIKWSGSKRMLSKQIISHFPKVIDTYIEPFCGSCAVLFELIKSNKKVNNYVCSDINKELIEFFNKVKISPNEIYKEYKLRWNYMFAISDIKEKQIYYNGIRTNYNKTKNIYDFIFLSRTSVNGLIRYNSKGEFNAPFHLTRNGIFPETFKNILLEWSDILVKNNVQFICQDYKNTIPKKGDYLFLDSPYAETKGMYFGVIDFNEYWEWLRNLPCNYSFTFDGKRNDTDNTFNVPKDVYSKHLYLDKKISGFKKLHEYTEYVSESLYISNPHLTTQN